MTGSRIVLLTGASGRLGRLVAEGLRRRGDHLVSLVRSVDEAVGETGSAYPCDVTDEESVVTVFEHVRSVHGRIDGLIHTVGGWALTPILETRRAEWQRMMDLNLTSTFLCLREAVRAMVAGGGGTILAIASGQGADRAPAEQAAYAAAKAGVIRLVEAAAAEFAHRGVVARVVAPSMILYDGMEGAGIRAGELARMCVDLSDPAWPVANGTLVRAYGDATPTDR